MFVFNEQPRKKNQALLKFNSQNCTIFFKTNKRINIIIAIGDCFNWYITDMFWIERETSSQKRFNVTFN